MKRILKSSLSLALALTIVLGSAVVGLGEFNLGGLLTVKAEAASVNDLSFRVNDDGESYSVISCESSASGNLIIPDTYNGLPVTSICKNAFRGCSLLTSVKIPDSVTSIGEYAFYGCDMLYDFKIENLEAWCLIEFGENMIDHSPWNLYLNDVLVTNLIIPENITEIKDFAFNGCGNITSIFIPEGVTRIGDFAFSNNHSLIEVDLPNGITYIGRSAFSATGIDNNTENRENGALYIGEYLIEVYELTSENYIIKDGTVLIAGEAFGWTFASDIQLHTVEIPDSVKYICDSAFSHCESLSEIVIPDSVTNIGEYAFYNCTSLESITIPDSVTSIGEYAFYDCDSLKAVYYGGNEEDWNKISIGSYNECLTNAAIYDNELQVIRPANMIYAYSVSNGEAEITGCFGSMDSEVTIPSEINGYPVTSIGLRAFEGCKSLTRVTIPDSVTSIKEDAFMNCSSLTSIIIPNSVTSIGHGAFSFCTSLTSITIPESVTDIGGCAFWWCESLTSVIIPNSVTSIDDDTFYMCTNLSSVTIPDSVTRIGDDAFFNCRSLTSVIIPNSVTRIGHSAFSGCEDLIYIFYTGSENEWFNITIGSLNESLHGVVHYNSTDHTASNWSTDKVATCTEDGFKHKECTVCGKVLETEIIPKLDHDYSNEWTIDIEATCTTEGSKSRHCSSCDSKADVTVITATGHTTSDWITDKEANASAAGSKHKECTVCKAVLETETIPQLTCSAPNLTKIENTSNGVKVTWEKPAGAQNYNVYRKTYSNGKWTSWSAIKTGVTSTSYTDTTVKSGVYYLYTVRAKNAAGLSSYNTTGLKIKFLSTPKLTSLSSGSGKTTLKWSKVTGATGYYIYRQTYSNGKWSGWKKVAATKNNYYNDTKVSGGNYYKYTVRAYNGNYTSYYNTNGVQTKYLAAAKISSASSRRDGILINWKKISGASGYYVYRKAPSGDWKRIATVKGNTKIKYLDETPRKGVTYQYCVKAYSGNYTGAYANTYKIKCKY